ncbi:ferritin-like domain-containing protein [Arenimonas sp.]|nr:ferritin-like domain-containing protein [Candidatus Parcubacteria bacterium]
MSIKSYLYITQRSQIGRLPIMIHQNKDDALINSAYLSEIWAVNDLIRLKSLFPSSWTIEREKQLQDEIRHANLLLNAMKTKKAVIVKDVNYSMQSRLYGEFLDLGKTQSLVEAAQVHEMTERRAVWIYRTYRRVGSDQDYKKVANEICQDEMEHFDINADQIMLKDLNILLSDSIIKIDNFIFQKYLPEKYGSIIFSSEDFWNFYYENAKY